ncbi:MAG TPA: response regulator [Cytophagales bacterium]|nr:response regulator [Cytophagales bacterium]
MSLKIVIVDDDTVAVYIHQNAIECSALSSLPVIALESEKALDYILNNKDSDQNYLVLLDINMPKVNGWDFLDKISASPIFDKVFVVIVTSSINTRDKEKALAYKNIIDFLEKPLEVEGLNRQRLSPEISRFFPD